MKTEKTWILMTARKDFVPSPAGLIGMSMERQGITRVTSEPVDIFLDELLAVQVMEEQLKLNPGVCFWIVEGRVARSNQ